MVKVKQKKSNRGAPKKSDKVNTYHLTDSQWNRLVQEATARNISPFALQRQAIDWFFTALDTGRADIKAFEMFDKEESNV